MTQEEYIRHLTGQLEYVKKVLICNGLPLWSVAVRSVNETIKYISESKEKNTK